MVAPAAPRRKPCQSPPPRKSRFGAREGEPGSQQPEPEEGERGQAAVEGELERRGVGRVEHVVAGEAPLGPVAVQRVRPKTGRSGDAAGGDPCDFETERELSSRNLNAPRVRQTATAPSESTTTTVARTDARAVHRERRTRAADGCAAAEGRRLLPELA